MKRKLHVLIQFEVCDRHNDCGHAFCNAHLLRELVFLREEHAQAWAKTMLDHLLAIKTAVDTARQVGQSALPAADIPRGSAFGSAADPDRDLRTQARRSQFPSRLDLVQDAVGQRKIAIAFRLHCDADLNLRVHAGEGF